MHGQKNTMFQDSINVILSSEIIKTFASLEAFEPELCKNFLMFSCMSYYSVIDIWYFYGRKFFVVYTVKWYDVYK